MFYLQFVGIHGRLVGMKGRAVTNSQIYWASALVGLSWVAAAVALALLNAALVWRLLIGLVPMAFLAWQLYLAFTYTQNQDEVMKRITLEALSISFLISLPLIFLIGYIIKAGIGLPLCFMDAGYVLEASVIIGYIIAWQRYR